jgi:hypothetical protein
MSLVDLSASNNSITDERIHIEEYYENLLPRFRLS